MRARFLGASEHKEPFRVDCTVTTQEMYLAVVEWLTNNGRLPANATCRVAWSIEAGSDEHVFKVDVMLLGEKDK